MYYMYTRGEIYFDKCKVNVGRCVFIFTEVFVYTAMRAAGNVYTHIYVTYIQRL